VASAHEVICEQYLRPSQEKLATEGEALGLLEKLSAGDGASRCVAESFLAW
jgi:hypothetical protein